MDPQEVDRTSEGVVNYFDKLPITLTRGQVITLPTHNGLTISNNRPSNNRNRSKSSDGTANPADQEKLLSPGERLGRPRDTPRPSDRFEDKYKEKATRVHRETPAAAEPLEQWTITAATAAATSPITSVPD